ncbi:MAG TPA: NYN domain-containing protein [Herpetosiphonaceae bacterium]|nr:NYN domain-containing protein [Herpetosiphonaceae bacterium]
MEKPTRDDVAVFVDFENVYVSVREKFDATPNFELIMDRCEDYGRIVIARAYADWYRYPRVTSALFANGVEPMYVPTYYYDRDVGRTGRPIKNSVDIHLCIDAMRTLFTQPNICKFVLVTGDRDFIPLVNAIRQHGKDVIVIGIGGAASAHLAQSADEFLFYEQIADLKTQGAPRPAEDGRRSDERRDGRDRDRGRSEAKPRPEAAPPVVETRQETPVPAPTEPAQEAPAEAHDPYDTLVDAVKLARQRGFVVNLGSLKVVMRELDSGFHESKVKDGHGRGFSKFKDFVKEAERQGKVQIFTNGTVTEVFLPGEDPYQLSQFAEDLASEQAERELETELAQATPEEVQTTPEPVVDVPSPVAEEPPAEELAAAIGVTEEPIPRTFGDREWEVFRVSMSQFTEPVRFAEIFNALRGLRNQEVVELTNNELKELVKQAINRGMLQRTGRGSRAYYRLSSQYRIKAEPTAAEPQQEQGEATSPVEGVQPVGEAPEVPAFAPPVAPMLRRRARSYVLPPISQADATVSDGTAEEPVAVQETPVEPTPTPVEPVAAQEAPGESAPVAMETATTPESTAEPTADAPEPAGQPTAAMRRRTRRKQAQATAAETNGAPTAEATSGPQEAGPAEASAAKPANRRQRKPATADETANPTNATEGQNGPEGRENGARKRRRRKKPAAAGGSSETSEEA